MIPRRPPRRPILRRAVSSAAEATDSNKQEFARNVEDHEPSSLHDIHHTNFLLRQVLVPDLVPAILDFAEYWLKSTAARAERVSVRERSAGFVYLKSEEIASKAVHPVRKVEIQVTSRDQGWSDHANHHGTYMNSWTWFEAGISREIMNEDGTTSRSIIKKREVCHNINAGKEDKTHTVTWYCNAVDEGEREWVRELKEGDSIALSVEARYAGWQNNVHSAQINVYTTGAIR
ncbi:MAG: hypothetical protein Q9227_003428 [Pyrenula ochraceoflavens]